MRAKIQRANTVIVHAEDLDVNVATRAVTLAGFPIRLKSREYGFLAMLVNNRGHAFTRDQILDSLWGEDYMGDTRAVDVHVRWLRKKIGAAPIFLRQFEASDTSSKLD